MNTKQSSDEYDKHDKPPSSFEPSADYKLHSAAREIIRFLTFEE